MVVFGGFGGFVWFAPYEKSSIGVFLWFWGFLGDKTSKMGKIVIFEDLEIPGISKI